MGGPIDKAWGWLAGTGWLLLLAGAPVHAGTLDSPGCMAGGGPAVVAGVGADLDLRLADGRTVRLGGIAVQENAAEAQRDLASWLTQAAVMVLPLHAEPDRWGRTVALVFAASPADPGRPVSVTEALIGAGRVLARPDPALTACWAIALRLEHEAERQRLGLWATSPVLAPGDVAGLRTHAGALAIVAGRLAAVREGRFRVYLRFADDAGTGMAAALALPLARRLTKAGTDPHGWVGRSLQVRGLLDDRWGWQIEVTDPQQMELDPP